MQKILFTKRVYTSVCCLFLLGSCVLASSLFAQPPNLRFQHFTVNDGLSHNSVYAILQDSQGFMWFGTYVGLTRYDGYTMKVYKHDPDDPYSLSHNAVIALYEDADHHLWIGTNEGLNRYDRQLDRFVSYMHDPENPNSLSHNRIDLYHGIHADRQGNMWISTKAGVDVFDPETEQFIHSNANPLIPEELREKVVYALYEDSRGNLWAHTDEFGLSCFEPQTGKLLHYAHDPDDRNSLSSNAIQSFFEDQSQNLWITTENGLNRFLPERGQFVRYVHDPNDASSLSGSRVMALAEDALGRLWIGTIEGGLNVFQPESETFLRYQYDHAVAAGLNDDGIRSLYYAPSGGLWVGTKIGGLNALMRGSERFTHYTADPENINALSHNVVYPIYEDREGIMWIGTRGGGLNRFDRDTATFTTYRHNPDDPTSLSSDHLRSIYEDRAGNLWIGTYNYNLELFDRNTEQFVHYPPDIDVTEALPTEQRTEFFAFLDDDQGRFWVATNRGLWLLNRSTGDKQIFEHIPDDPKSLSHTTVLALHEDAAGNFWVGTAGGLNRFDRDTGTATRFMYDAANPSSLSSNKISSIYEDRAGRLWIGTDRGLNLFDRTTGVFTHYREKDGLPNERIYGILEDSAGNLWMSTNMGISRFDPEQKIFTNYDERDGLQGNEFNSNSYCQTRDGLMLFGGFNGFNAFYPNKIQDNPYLPPIVLTDFQLFQKPVPIHENTALQQAISITHELTLSYRDFIVSFEFAALNFIAPEKNRYRYRMEGFETDWNESGATRRFVTYTNLKAGQYVFRVQGSNNDGVWNEDGVSLALTITPPWWERWWARGFAGVMVLVIVFAVYQMRVQALQRRKMELEEEVDVRTKELRDEIDVREKVERALRESEERFRSIVETTPSLLCITDAEKILLYVSPNCQEFLGYAQHEMVGTFRWWTHDDDTPRAQAMMERIFSDHVNGRNFEYKAVRKNGDVWYASSAWEPVHDADGAFLGIVMQTLDITERKQAEQERRRLYEQTRQDAEVKAELLREVNHRVGNNLTAIVGMLSLERRFMKRHDQMTYQSLMQDLSNRVNGLARVHDLLSASEWSPVLVHELVERVVHSSLQIVPLDTYVTVDIEPADIRVNADQAHHLALILNELATNTAKYAVRQHEAANIAVSCSRADGMLQIVFQDDGPGYPDDVLQLQRQNVGLHLIQQLMQRNLQGEWTLGNENGALTTLRFPLEHDGEDDL